MVDAIIDKDYRGELFIQVVNNSSVDVTVMPGDRLVQIVPHRLIRANFVLGELPGSPRGADGFGSTGGIS